MRMLAALLILTAAATPAAAQLDPRALQAAVARPPAGARLPASIVFRDQRAATVTLGQVAAGRPLVLLFADYTCRHVCGPGLSLTAAALADTRLAAGRDYALAVVGLDPRDDVDAARAFAGRIGDPAVARATSLLVGSRDAVSRAERALGYGAVYDAGTDQWAHDASVYVFDRDGRMTTLLPELGLRPEPLRAALAGAPIEEQGLADRVARLCYGLSAAHGRYGGAIVAALQALALLMLAGGALLVWRRRRA